MSAAKPVALITGRANGIGRAIASHLVASGWQISIIDLPDSAACAAALPASEACSPSTAMCATRKRVPMRLEQSLVSIQPGLTQLTRTYTALRKKDHQQHPAGRVGKPQDVAELVSWLLDGKRSGFVTGANFVIDGGMTRKMIYEE